MRIFIVGFKKIFFIYVSIFFQVLLLIFIWSCSAHTNLEPVGPGNVETSIGLGGPFIPLAETKIPAPYLAIGTNYGLSEYINVDGNLHITSLFYQVAWVDLGATWFPTINEGLIPTWGIQPRLLLLASVKGYVSSRFRIYPFISTSAAWELGSGLIYGGFDFVFPLTEPDYDQESANIIVSPFAGYRWNLGSNIRLLTELKWHGANIQSNQLVVEYISIGGYGAFSLMLSLEKRL